MLYEHYREQFIWGLVCNLITCHNKSYFTSLSATNALLEAVNDPSLNISFILPLNIPRASMAYWLGFCTHNRWFWFLEKLYIVFLGKIPHLTILHSIQLERRSSNTRRVNSVMDQQPIQGKRCDLDNWHIMETGLLELMNPRVYHRSNLISICQKCTNPVVINSLQK